MEWLLLLPLMVVLVWLLFKRNPTTDVKRRRPLRNSLAYWE